MSYDILQSIPQGGNGAQDAEDSRIAEIADELERLCRIHEAQRGAGQSDVVSYKRGQTPFVPFFIQSVTEAAKPLMDLSRLRKD